jgi:hypothetical protein
MGLVISKGLTLRKGWQPMDTDAAAYITAVETADGQALEEKTKIAIDNFVLGCKADGIWSAIKASCILAGARTLAGALVPLVGTAPTNSNFVSGDYTRKTGITKSAGTKTINTNRANNADPQNSHHVALYMHTVPSASIYLLFSGTYTTIERSGSDYFTRNRSSTANSFLASTVSAGLLGMSRAASGSYTRRVSGTNTRVSQASSAPDSASQTIFASFDGTTTGRVAFYSIGESLDLALLDARVTDLINAFGAAIP